MRINVFEIIIFGLVNGSIYALISMGLSMQYGVAKILNVAHGEFIMLGSFLTWGLVRLLVPALAENQNMPVYWAPIFALLISLPITLLIGFILHRTAYKRLKTISPNDGAFEGSAMLLSFGIMFVVQAVAQWIWGTTPHNITFNAVPLKISITDGISTEVQRNRLIVFTFAVAISAIFYLFLAKSRTGKSIRAAAQDPVAASLMGIKINTVLALCFGLGTLLAGAAGALLSMYKDSYTSMGMGYTVTAIIVVVLGGLGSIPGSVIGGFFLGLVGYAVSTINSSLEIIVFYLFIMALLLVRPKGLFGR